MKIITVGRQQVALKREAHAGVLEVVVPFRTIDQTGAALKFAATMGQGLNWSVRLVDVQVVPIQFSNAAPPVGRKFSENRLQVLAEAAGVPVRADLVYARDWEEAFIRLLKPESLVVLAIRKRFWKTAEQRLAERLTKQGHQVILVEYK